MLKLENPPILVVAGMRWRHPFGIFFYFGRRWRRFRRALLAAEGLLLYQELVERPRGLLPQTFLALSWWRDRESLKAFYNHPLHQEMIRWADSGDRPFDLWIEEYVMREPGSYRGARAPLPAALEASRITLRKVQT